MSVVFEVNDLTDSRLAPYVSLNENQLRRIYEPKAGIFVAESFKVICRALKAGYEPESMLVSTDKYDGDVKALAETLDIPVYIGAPELLGPITGFSRIGGELCVMKRKTLLPIETICSGAERIVWLENVENPTNVGAIFRSAAAMGMDAVVLSSGCSDPLYRRSVRVSMGNVFLVPWTVAPTGGRRPQVGFPDGDFRGEKGIKELKRLGFKTVAMALRHDDIGIDDPVLKTCDKLAIILGNEGDGLPDEVVDACDYVAKIPMAEGVDSLNVAAASAVAFWELRKTRDEEH